MRKLYCILIIQKNKFFILILNILSEINIYIIIGNFNIKTIQFEEKIINFYYKKKSKKI